MLKMVLLIHARPSYPMQGTPRWLHMKGGSGSNDNDIVNHESSDSISALKSNASSVYTSNRSINGTYSSEEKDVTSSSSQHMQSRPPQQMFMQPQSPSQPIQPRPVSSYVDEQIKYLNSTYKHFQPCFLPAYPNCCVYLCGTIHVTQRSVHFVKDGWYLTPLTLQHLTSLHLFICDFFLHQSIRLLHM